MTIDDFRRRFGKVPEAMLAAEQRAVGLCAKVVEARVRRHFVGYTQTSGASLASVGLVRKRTGHLLDSTNSSTAMKDAMGYYATVGFRKGVVNAYAKTIEEGVPSGAFTPKTAKLLAIPVGKALTPGGDARYQSPKNVEGGFWAVIGGVLGLWKSEGKRLSLFFVGTKRIPVKAIRPLRRSLDGERPRFPAIFNAEIDKAIGRALGSG